jgi:hypothetical protein
VWGGGRPCRKAICRVWVPIWAKELRAIAKGRYFWLEETIISIDQRVERESATCCGVNLAVRHRFFSPHFRTCWIGVLAGGPEMSAGGSGAGGAA